MARKIFILSDRPAAYAADVARRLGKTAAAGVEDLSASRGDAAALVQQGTVVLVVSHKTEVPHYNYHVKVVTFDDDSRADVVDRVVERLTATPWFKSTRGCGGGEGYGFLEVVRTGLAADGGLFIPQYSPTFDVRDFKYLAGLSNYTDAAQVVLERYIAHTHATRTVTPAELRDLIARTYTSKHWSDPEICPARKVGDATYVLELFHGPTAAFKDFALQLFPKFFTKSIADQGGKKYTILAATSGDTGVAAINGFMQEKGISVFVLYPKDGVSVVQRRQMLACDGGNVRVLGLDADFDFCQTTVKRIFGDKATAKDLLDKHRTVLSSANSINWGRLLPQIVYYFWGYSRLVREGALQAGEPMDVVVPTGNFGNILSAYFAKKSGLPIRRFVCASNENNVLTDFINTGVYDISRRRLTITHSPSIDILKSSNVERFLYLLSDGDCDVVCGLMQDLDTKKRFTLPPAMFARLRADFSAAFSTEADCLATIGAVQKAHGYVLDTHTAVGYKVMQDYRRTHPQERVPTLLAATASFAKFPFAVQEALTGKATPDADPKDVYAAIESLTGAKAPPALQRVVDISEVPQPRTCPRDEGKVVEHLKAFSATPRSKL